MASNQSTPGHGPLDSPARFVLISDLDWTMVDHHDKTHDKLLRFNNAWNTELANDSLLIYSSGRSPHLYEKLAAEVPLLKPDILVCSVGTEIFFEGEPHKPWSDFLDKGWDREKALSIARGFPGLTLQEDSEQRPHKISFRVAPGSEGLMDELRAALKQAGLEVNVIYSAGVDVDLLPAAASKGKALSFLLEEMAKGPGTPEDGVLVAGDSGNDIELFAVPGVHGCMVANAHPELREWCAAHASPKLYQASQDGPGGIFQALEHFGFMTHAEPRPAEVEVRRAVVGMQTAEIDLYCGVLSEPSPEHVASLGDFLTNDFQYSHDGFECGRKDYLDYLGGAGYNCMKARYPGPGVWRGWVRGLHANDEGAGTWIATFQTCAQRFDDSQEADTSSSRVVYDGKLTLKETEPGVWKISEETFRTLPKEETYNTVANA